MDLIDPQQLPERSGTLTPPKTQSGFCWTDTLASLTDRSLDPLFWRAERLGVESAWWEHVPFAHWIVCATSPRVLVELGTHTGVSYSAFCHAVLRAGLGTRCHAVDTWQGDPYTGLYGPEVLHGLRGFHDERFGSFSTLLQSTFDEALDQIEDGSIDLLHIDGLHTYEAVRHDFENWLRKLSDRAVVLFHDINVRRDDFGVWRLWAELRERYPAFDFVHGHGLGVLAVGANIPAPVAALCELNDPAAIAMIRTRFARLGERWSIDTRERLMAQHIGQLRAELEQHNAEAEQLRAEARRHAYEAARLRHELADVLRSTSWLITEPARRLASVLPPGLRRQGRRVARIGYRLLTPHRTGERIACVRARFRVRRSLKLFRKSPTMASPIPQLSGRRDIEAASFVYVSGEPDTPGHHYRVLRPAATLKLLGMRSSWMGINDIPARLEEISSAEALIIWRAPWDEWIATAVDVARRGGIKVVFDVDDLMFLPEVARSDTIDGIRTQGLTEDMVRDHYSRMRSTLAAADLCVATTEELAQRMREAGKPAFVLPNGMDQATITASRLAVRRRRFAGNGDGLLRIGYAGGTRTHQRDFAICADAVAAALRARPECRLVVFRSADKLIPVLDIEEFTALHGLEEQIEWRDLVPLEQLPDEMARFDVNLAPLEMDNPYCEAKSELKLFEAALVDVPTIASPTGPLRRAVRHGETGFLAATPEHWREMLARLIDDPELRHRMARAARREALWRFGPDQRAETMALMVDLLRGGRRGARAFQARICLPDRLAEPPFADHDVVFESDGLGTADVTVVIPLYNYAEYVEEALDSVYAQTLSTLDLIVVEDRSTDRSLDVALQWLQVNAPRFNRVLLLRNRINAGLARTRNNGFEAAETPFIIALDADNRLLPDCAAACLRTVRDTGANFAYPVIRQFGAGHDLMGTPPYDPLRLISGNYIDAMALISKAAWVAAGGYNRGRGGWEDYAFWCCIAERGLWGEQVPGGPLAEYRVHPTSMIQVAAAQPDLTRLMIDELSAAHPWLRII